MIILEPCKHNYDPEANRCLECPMKDRDGVYRDADGYWCQEKVLEYVFTKFPLNEHDPAFPKYYPPTRYNGGLFGCGSCGHELPKGRPNFCSYCGNAVQWEAVK